MRVPFRITVWARYIFLSAAFEGERATHLLQGTERFLDGVSNVRVGGGALEGVGGTLADAGRGLWYLLRQQVRRFVELGLNLSR